MTRLPFADYYREVIDHLCSLGLPLNVGMMPTRETVQPFHARGFPVEAAKRAFTPVVRRYEAWRKTQEKTQEKPKKVKQ